MLITENILRARRGANPSGELCLASGDVLTPAARDYIREHHIKLVWCKEDETPCAFKSGYKDNAGRRYRVKPEHMTHLYGNYLVPKTHPRIALRGKLDCLQAKVLEGQVLAEKQAERALVLELEEVLGFLRRLLACEVKEEPFEWDALLGMDEAALRKASHDPEKFCGMPFRPPSYKMGELAVCLNSLRASAREVELAAVAAFTDEGGEAVRKDILQSLNRLSSAFHILYCRQAVRKKGEWQSGHDE
ncbi:MAG: hypothetical protein FWE19_00770 [Oscillospiraceae bacterium]|nr:hypothetical protein [Oscillospiraceae bacterium]